MLLERAPSAEMQLFLAVFTDRCGGRASLGDRHRRHGRGVLRSERIEHSVDGGKHRPRFVIGAMFLVLRKNGGGNTKREGESRFKVHGSSPHIRNTPNPRSSTGAFSVAAKASPRTSRVCAGSMMPSSQRRAVA